MRGLGASGTLTSVFTWVLVLPGTLIVFVATGLFGTGNLVGNGFGWLTVTVAPGMVIVVCGNGVNCMGGRTIVATGKVMSALGTAPAPEGAGPIDSSIPAATEAIALPANIFFMLLIGRPFQSCIAHVRDERCPKCGFRPCTEAPHVLPWPQKGEETLVACRFPSYRYYKSSCVD
jgi:hypothetical protein